MVRPGIAPNIPSSDRVTSLAVPQTSNAYCRRYLQQALRNLTWLEDAGDVATLAGAGRGVPAIVAAAGPSLNRNLEELSSLRDAGGDSALLLSVDMTLATCVAAGFDPHFAVAAGAGSGVSHLRGVPACPATWMVTELGSDPAAFEQFEGRILVFRAAEHDLAPWPWLTSRGIDRGILRGSASTIAAIDFARLLGCDPIILIGADFAYTGGQPCCRGTVHERTWSEAVAGGQSLRDIWQPWLTAPGWDTTDLRGDRTRVTATMVALRDTVLSMSMDDTHRRFVNATGAGILSGGAFVLDTLAAALPAGPTPRHPALTRLSSSPSVARALPRVAALERELAHDVSSVARWQAAWEFDAEPDELTRMVSEAIEHVHLYRVAAGRGAGPGPAVHPVQDGLPGRLTAATEPDTALADELAAWLARESWRQWPLADRVQLIHDVARLFGRTWSALTPRVYPALIAIFKSTLTPDLPAGLAARLYESLGLLHWMTSDDAQKVASFRSDVVAPFAHHVRQWAQDLQLAPRRLPGNPPYRVAYMGQSCELIVSEAVTPLIHSLLTGHASLGTERFRFFYYALNGLTPAYRREVETLGVTVREFEAASLPCASLARLRSRLDADRIDALLCLDPMGPATVLYATRSAPVQMLLDAGFSAWLGSDSLDYTMLSFAGDPTLLDLSPTAHERIDYHFDTRFVFPAVDPEEVAAQRARFDGARHVYGFVGRLVKLTPDYFRVLRGILERVSDARIYLGGFGDATAIRDALSAFGSMADRVIVDPHAVNGPVLMHAIDTFLDTFPFIGGLACLQAQAARRPVVYMADARPGFARLLGVSRDSTLKASSLDDYVALASRLALDPTHYEARAREARRVATRMTHVASTAAAVEDALDRLIQRAREQ
jgi:hypothetical protein